MVALDARGKIIVALDVATMAEALALVRLLKDHIGLFKIGLELFTAEGPSVVEAVLAEGGKVFLDLKYHDIPNTVRKAAIAACKPYGPNGDRISMFNMHSSAGTEAMKEAADVGERSGVLSLGVTVLTSLSEEAQKIYGAPAEDKVLQFAEMAKGAGMDGLVCSALEVGFIKESPALKDMPCIVPGIRFGDSGVQDQKRVGTPYVAITSGADYLVIGRDITGAKEENGGPVAAAQRAAREIAEGLKDREAA